MPKPLVPMLTPKEVAAILRESEERLAEWRSQGVALRYYRPRHRILYHPDDVREFLDASCHEAVQAEIPHHGR